MCPTAVTWSLRQQTCGKLVSTWIQWFFVTETAEQKSLQGLQEIIQDHSPDTMTRSAAVVSLLTNDCLTCTCDHPEVTVSQHLQQSVPMPPPATAQNHRIKGMKGTCWIFKSWPPTSNHTTTWPLSNVFNVLSSLMMPIGVFFFFALTPFTRDWNGSSGPNLPYAHSQLVHTPTWFLQFCLLF